ncbi:MAG: LPS export ABC transporter periplasmic protein LptC [Nitrosomonadales bacterium]|nr:MAG: LPS export ABC transporter periplasmic protein LptC [Nitrosomonadales bacterium]
MRADHAGARHPGGPVIRLSQVSDRLTLWFPLVLLGLLALLTFWLNSTVQAPLAKRDGSTRHDPDFWVENFFARRMGPDGLPLHTLAAVKLEHFPDDDTSHLTRPHFVAMSGQKPPVHIQAQQGLVSSDGEEVYFTREVEVQREAGAGKDWLTIHTDYLHITPDLEIARTHKAVTIRTPAALITATGMEFNNRTQAVKLLSRVKGHYEKPKL